MASTEKEFCWSCRQRVPKSEIDVSKGQFTSEICKDCESELMTNLALADVKLVQNDRKPHYSAWHSKDVIIRDVFLEKDGQRYFIRGFHTCDAPYDTTSVFNLVKQFIKNNYRWIKFYGNLDILKEHDFWFDVQKTDQFYRFGGNCHDLSNAFSMKTLDIEQIYGFIEAWTKIPQSLKQRIIKQLDKGLIFASNPKHFNREKQFCFKEYLENSRDPKVTILKNIHY